MNFTSLLRALVVGSLVGFVVSFASCGGNKCTPSNCGGCCDSNGACKTGIETTACGTQGLLCTACTTGQTCSAGACKVGGTGGGSGGGTAGGAGTGGGTAGGAAGGSAGGSAGGTGGGSGEVSCAQTGTCTAGLTCVGIKVGTTVDAVCRTGCDPVKQDCPTTTDTCTYGAVSPTMAGRTCVPAGTVAEGGTCTGDECAKGLTCVGSQSGGASTCAKYCASDSDCTGGKGCNQPVAVGNGSDEIFITCSTKCSLAQQDCTPTTNACIPISATGTICYPAGTVAIGGACTATSTAPAPCVKEATCVGPSGGATTCKKWCALDGGTPNCGASACNPVGLGGGMTIAGAGICN